MQTNRRKEANEAKNPNKLKRIGLTMTCLKCGQSGHNKSLIRKVKLK